VIHDAELYTVAPDEVVVTFRTDHDETVTTCVGERSVTTFGRYHSAQITGLDAATEFPLRVDGVEPTNLLPATVTTLERPPGRLVATVATVNDVHFGEDVCGKLGTPEELGPVFTTPPGETPYWETMNTGAIAEIDALDPDAVVVKGDLTNVGADWEYERFVDAYSRLGARMRHVRGNHDALLSQHIAPGHFAVDLEGVTLAVLDTVVPASDRGRVPAEQLEWLDGVAAESTEPVLVFGHHHPWDPSSHQRNDTYFGINPDDSEALCAVFARRPAIVGYFAGHTHRNRVRHFPQARNIPIVEVACVKDYPGAWAEYRIHEGGYTQLARRIATPAAMDWTEKTRGMFAGLYRDYALGSLADRCFTRAF
jgi:3',5'-cyclic-AMP phosphodiesterase